MEYSQLFHKETRDENNKKAHQDMQFKHTLQSSDNSNFSRFDF